MGVKNLADFLKNASCRSLESYHHVYVEINCLLHDILWIIPDLPKIPNQQTIWPIFEKMLSEILRKIRPTKTLYLVIDGPSTAKLQSQISRRQELTEHQNSLLGIWKIALSPCTTLMLDISYLLQDWARKFAIDNPNLQVLFSSPEATGEGEQKVFQHLVLHSRLNPTLTHAVISSDADIVLWGLMSLANHLHWIRVEFSTNVFGLLAVSINHIALTAAASFSWPTREIQTRFGVAYGHCTVSQYQVPAAAATVLPVVSSENLIPNIQLCPKCMKGPLAAACLMQRTVDEFESSSSKNQSNLKFEDILTKMRIRDIFKALESGNSFVFAPAITKQNFALPDTLKQLFIKVANTANSLKNLPPTHSSYSCFKSNMVSELLDIQNDFSSFVKQSDACCPEIRYLFQKEILPLLQATVESDNILFGYLHADPSLQSLFRKAGNQKLKSLPVPLTQKSIALPTSSDFVEVIVKTAYPPSPTTSNHSSDEIQYSSVNSDSTFSSSDSLTVKDDVCTPQCMRSLSSLVTILKQLRSSVEQYRQSLPQCSKVSDAKSRQKKICKMYQSINTCFQTFLTLISEVHSAKFIPLGAHKMSPFLTDEQLGEPFVSDCSNKNLFKSFSDGLIKLVRLDVAFALLLIGTDHIPGLCDTTVSTVFKQLKLWYHKHNTPNHHDGEHLLVVGKDLLKLNVSNFKDFLSVQYQLSTFQHVTKLCSCKIIKEYVYGLMWSVNNMFRGTCMDHNFMYHALLRDKISFKQLMEWFAQENVEKELQDIYDTLEQQLWSSSKKGLAYDRFTVVIVPTKAIHVLPNTLQTEYITRLVITAGENFNCLDTYRKLFLCDLHTDVFHYENGTMFSQHAELVSSDQLMEIFKNDSKTTSFLDEDEIFCGKDVEVFLEASGQRFSQTM